MLNRISIDSNTYNAILDMYPKYVEYVENLHDYLARGYSDKRKILVEDSTKTLIIQGYRIPNITMINDWMQIVCTCDESLDSPQEVKIVPYANQANSLIEKKILSKYYTKDEIVQCLNDHSLKVRRKPLHILLPTTYHDGHVHKFNNCVYYDTNGAHTDALCEIFPKAKRELIRLHHNAKKDYINIYVGDLCNRGFRGTFDWIVERTRSFIEDVYNRVGGGLIIYANTDGIIIYNPKNKLATSTKIGDIKSESLDGIVYAYYCESDDETTAYTIYQYQHPTKGKQLKGNARLSIRSKLDLPSGKVVFGKLKRENHRETMTNIRVKEVTVDEEP